MSSRIRRTLPITLGLLAFGPLGATAWAQGNVFNPFGNSGYADYRDSGNPSYPGNQTEPGQTVNNSRPIVTRPRANSFQDYTADLDTLGSDASESRRATSNLPYYQAYQLQNYRNNRVYRPNEQADRKFNERMKQRDAAYAKAMEEKDPYKRARLLRQIEQDSYDRSSPSARSRSTSGSATSGSGSTTGRGATSANTGSSTRAPSPYRSTNPGTASRAPSPYPSSRPSTGDPARREAPPSPYSTSSGRRSTAPVPPVPPSRNSRPSNAPNPNGPSPDPAAIPPTPPPG